MFKDWNFWLTLVTTGVAIGAVIQTNKQIKLSNKQHLFDKRIENYLIVTGLIQLYRSNCSIFDIEKDEPLFTISLDFTFMTNNTYLEQITPAIYNPLKEPNHKELLIKLDNLKEVSTKIKLLFSGEASVLLGDFVLRYQELLHEMYKYQMILNKMEEASKGSRLTLEECQKAVGEEKYRVKLKEAFYNLKDSEMMLTKENVEAKIKKQIKLR